MTSSGTEATMSALRLARAVTGREKIIKFAGAYHGHVDGLLVEAGSGLATQGIPASPGVPAGAAAATVIVAPGMTRTPCWSSMMSPRSCSSRSRPTWAWFLREPGFLETLREEADHHGALLIFDEVITGFRVARGGAQEHYRVLPDLTIMGKIIGGGLPAAAYGGSRELMELIAPAGDVYQAGTLSGNPLAVAAALATLRQLDDAAYERLAATTEALADGLRDGRRRCRLPGRGPERPRPVDGVLLAWTGLALRRCRPERHRRLRCLVPRAAGAWCVPATVAVRGVVPVAGARARARGADRGGGPRGVRGGGAGGEERS